MKKTILIAEDFETSAFVLETTLRSQGFEIINTASGSEALEQFNGQIIDLLITDYHIPEMNGLQLVSKVKLNENYIKMPIFLLSTDSSKAIVDEAKKLGVTAWIKKPFKVEQLVRLINRAFAMNKK